MDEILYPECPHDDDIHDAFFDAERSFLLSEKLEHLRPLVEKMQVGQRLFSETESVAVKLRSLAGDCPKLHIARLLQELQRLKANGHNEKEIAIAEKKWIEPERLFEKFNGLIRGTMREIELSAHAWKYQKLAKKGHAFTVGPKEPRLDALGKEMRRTAKSFRELNGKLPTARELFQEIPTGGKIQEKDEDVIFWRSGNKEHETTFKAFGNRYSRIKRDFLQKK